MIGHIAAAVAADLRRRKFPGPCVYGPERCPRDDMNHYIVFVRDREAAEPVVAPAGAKDRNPDVPFHRHAAGRVTVYVRSPKPGATVLDHEDESDDVCNGVITAIRRVLVARKSPHTISEVRLLTREELRAEDAEGPDRSGHRSADWPGCVARIRFTVAMAVRDVTYTGAAQATAEIDDVDCPVITSDGFDDYDPAPGAPP